MTFDQKTSPDEMARETATDDGCQARMRPDTYSVPSRCRKPVKGALTDGTPVCGIHLAVEGNRTRKKEERDRQRAMQDRIREAVQTACSELAAFGINATPDSMAGFGYTGKIITSPGEILGALRTRSIQISEGRHGGSS